MSYLLKLVFAMSVVIFSGCSVQPPREPISLEAGALSEGQKVGIVMSAVPEPTMTYPGAGCLLCLATAAAANGDLSGYAKGFSTDDLSSIPELVMAAFNEQGLEGEIISEAIDFKKLKKLKKSKTLRMAKYDFSSYMETHGVSHLIVIDLSFVGIQRPYSSYFPTGAPQAVIVGTAYMVDLNSHNYQAFRTISAHVDAVGEWKEKPNYPTLTNAYYQAVENVRDNTVQAFTFVDRPQDDVVATNQVAE